MEIIAGDIGGTKSWLVWVVGDAYASQKVRFEHVYASADFSDMGALLQRFMHDAAVGRAPDSLTLALPGVVQNKQAPLTNLDWRLDADQLAAQLSIPAVHFLNDFQAAAVAVETLTAADTCVLNVGQAQAGGIRAITGAGTGLGLAWMQADARGVYQPFASEGGHADFAPANAQQDALLSFVRSGWAMVPRRMYRGSVSFPAPGWRRCIGFAQAKPDRLAMRSRSTARVSTRWRRPATRSRMPRSICSSTCTVLGSVTSPCCISPTAGCISQAAWRFICRPGCSRRASWRHADIKDGCARWSSAHRFTS
jgi:Glucokinase